jgi:hypothetical protein
MKDEVIPRQTVTMGEPSENWSEHDLAAGQKHVYTWRYEAGPYEKIEIKSGSFLMADLIIFPDGYGDSVTISKTFANYYGYLDYLTIGTDTTGTMRLEITGPDDAEFFGIKYSIKKYHQKLLTDSVAGEYRDTTSFPAIPVTSRTLTFEDSLTDNLSFAYPDSRYTFRVILKPFEIFQFNINDFDVVAYITSHNSVINGASCWNENGDTIEVTISLAENTMFSRFGIWDEKLYHKTILFTKRQMPVVQPDRFSKDTGVIVLDIDTSYVLSQIRQDYDEYIYVVTQGNIYNLKIEWDSSQYMNAYVSVDGTFKYRDYSMDTSLFILMPLFSDTIFVRIDKDDYYLSTQYTMQLTNYTGPLSQDNYEPDGAIQKAGLLVPDSVQTHSIFPAKESDFFKFSLQAQDTFSISINSDDSAALAEITAELSGTIDFPISSDITFTDSSRTAGYYSLTGVKRFTDTLYLKLSAPDYLPYTVLLRKY